MPTMRRIYLEEMKQIQIHILDAVTEYCKANNINYWLDSGTLLGAIRHKGYIPWDDDIDLGMLREDYDRFIKSFNDSSDKYKVNSVEIDPLCPFPFAKVMDVDTILYEPDEKDGVKYSVSIDIFVYDNAPDDEAMVREMFARRDYCQRKQSLQSGTIRNLGPLHKRLAKHFLFYILKLVPQNYYCRKLIENSRRYVDLSCNKVGNFTSVSKVVADKELFSSFVEVEFEGKKYNAPVGYDEWLRLFYGNYMQLPPVEKRVSHHQFIAYHK